MRVVIPAGGEGRRFQQSRPGAVKELLPLGGRPLIAHALEEAAQARFDEAVIVVSPAKTELVRHLETSARPLPTRSVEQRGAAGLGDAVRVASTAIGDEAFSVLLPDDVVREADLWDRMRSAHAETGAAVIAVRDVPREQAHRFGMAVCSFDGSRLRVEELIEKPERGSVDSTLAVFGRYIVNARVRAALAAIPRGAIGELQLTDAFGAALAEPPGVVAVRFDGEFFDCGTPDEYDLSVARYRE